MRVSVGFLDVYGCESVCMCGRLYSFFEGSVDVYCLFLYISYFTLGY